MTTLSNPIFLEAISEISALGLQVSERPAEGATAYGVVGGRSNSRWWLVPLTNRQLMTSGMALFQPVLLGSRMIKEAALMAGNIGLSPLWANKKIYISGKSLISEQPGMNDAHYSYFTGTDGPHRKVAVQIMDIKGNIAAYAKISRRNEVKALLEHEANTLDHLNSIDIRSAKIPKVLYRGLHGDLGLLVTDTIKTPHSATRLGLERSHLDFFMELSRKSSSASGQGRGKLADSLEKRYAALAERLCEPWRKRIEHGMYCISLVHDDLPPATLSHGDFTPWNTFFADDQLYVFDWEYSDRIYPPGYDLIHFMLSLPRTRRQSAVNTVDHVLKTLNDTQCAEGIPAARAIFIAYLCGHALHYIGRTPEHRNHVEAWDGAQRTAGLLDTLLAL